MIGESRNGPLKWEVANDYVRAGPRGSRGASFGRFFVVQDRATFSTAMLERRQVFFWGKSFWGKQIARG